MQADQTKSLTAAISDSAFRLFTQSQCSLSVHEVFSISFIHTFDFDNFYMQTTTTSLQNCSNKLPNFSCSFKIKK